ncbi:MAG: AAA family ATPase [Chloroflexota bacterium]
MITRIEINGFKSFHNFAMDLLPFQVFIGPNGVGKTNLFEAIILLSDLANHDTLDSALGQSRGEISELFTAYPDGTSAEKMSFAAEVLIGRTVTDELSGKSQKVSSTRLRYELDLERQVIDSVDRVYVVREDLSPIPESDDKWVKTHIPTKTRKSWAIREKRAPYIATEEVKGQQTIHINQDLPVGGRESFTIGQLTQTAISSTSFVRYPTAFAVRQEMQHWRFLQLNPAMLRTRSAQQANTTLLPDGSNLAAAIDYTAHQDEKALSNMVRDMITFIPDLRNIVIRPIAERSEFVLEVEMRDGSKFSSGVLSDGTLRLLALVTLKHDPRHTGVVCFEEPENGVQPQRLKQIVDVLYALSTNLATQDPERPLRQVLINTHSPEVLANVPNESLFYVGMKLQERGRETHIVPVRAVLFGDTAENYYTWEQVRLYLDSTSLNKKRDELGL